MVSTRRLCQGGVADSAGNPDPASITYQNFFLLYPRLAGMTGTAKTEEEFEKTYKLQTTIVPTNRRARQDWSDQVYKTESAKGGRANETADIHKKDVRCWWVPRR